VSAGAVAVVVVAEILQQLLQEMVAQVAQEENLLLGGFQLL
jgi:hypothetical protein